MKIPKWVLQAVVGILLASVIPLVKWIMDSQTEAATTKQSIQVMQGEIEKLRKENKQQSRYLMWLLADRITPSSQPLKPVVIIP